MFAMCAPQGLDGFIDGLGLTAVLGAFALLGLLCYFSIRDAYRFGRKGLSWFAGLVSSAILAGIGFCAAGPVGTVAGAPMLLAFGIGKITSHPR